MHLLVFLQRHTSGLLVVKNVVKKNDSAEKCHQCQRDADEANRQYSSVGFAVLPYLLLMKVSSLDPL